MTTVYSQSTGESVSKAGLRNSKGWRIWSMFLKEIQLIRIDKFALVLVFILPTMVMGTLYLAINQGTASGGGESSGGGKNVLRLGVVDMDPTDTYPGEDLSENFTVYLSKNPGFIVYNYSTEELALAALYRDLIDAYAVLPYGFEGNITGDIPAFVELHISSTNFESQINIFTYFSEVVNDFRADHGWSKGEITTNRILEFKPTGNYTAATFGAFILVFAVFIAVAATAAQAIVGDVPLNRMLLTPATKMEAILSKTLAYFMFGLIQSVFLVVLWMGLFGILPFMPTFDLGLLLSFVGNIMFVLMLMALSGSALGVLISTLVQTRLQANQSFLFLLLGSLIVGTGFMDVGIVDDVYPLNIGRQMIIDLAFKNVELVYFTGQITLIIAMSIFFMLVAYIVFSLKKTLA